MKREKSLIYLIRHGETDANILKQIQGKSHISINQKGKEQAEKIALVLKHIPFEAVYSSEEIRAKDTASFFSNHFTKKEELNEINWGVFNGLSWDEADSLYPDLMKNRDIYGYKFKYPNGESSIDVMNRAIFLMNLLCDKHKVCLCVTHSGFLKLLIAKILLLDYSRLFSLNFDNGSYTLISRKKEKWKVECLNCKPL